MEPFAKKPKLNESSEEWEFLDLSDDCIRDIFWKLPPTDLCSMSFTCTRLQELAFDHFPRQYRDEQVEIKIDESKKPQFVNEITKKHLNYFRKCIQNVRIISSGTHDDLQCLFDFLKTECCANLRTLQLDIRGRMKTANVEVIKSQLENLSSLFVHFPHSRQDIHCVLKYCKKLEHLEILSHSNHDAFWMLHEYPTMKSLSIELDMEEQISQFDQFAKKFFQLNQQIKNLECSENDVTKAILFNVINIERLVLRFYSWRDLIAVINHLKDYSKQSLIKWLELSIEPDNTTVEDYKAVANLNAVQPIHSMRIFLTGVINELTFISQLKSVVQLKFSVPDHYHDQNKLLVVLSEELPNLQDLELNLWGEQFVFKDVAMQFIRNSFKMRNLTFVFCHSSTFIFHPNDLVELNDSRSSITCASPISICLEYHKHENFERPVFNYSGKSVLNLKFTALHADYEL